MNYGRMKNGVVVDVASEPSKQFHPVLAAEFVEIPDNVTVGYTFDGTSYAPPAVQEIEPEPELEPEQNRSISPVDFKFLFTLVERVKIKELRSTDLALDDFYSMLDDPRLLVVNLDDVRMVEGIKYAVAALVDASVISESDQENRTAEILGGVYAFDA